MGGTSEKPRRSSRKRTILIILDVTSMHLGQKLSYPAAHYLPANHIPTSEGSTKPLQTRRNHAVTDAGMTASRCPADTSPEGSSSNSQECHSSHAIVAAPGSSARGDPTIHEYVTDPSTYSRKRQRKANIPPPQRRGITTTGSQPGRNSSKACAK